MNNETTIDMVNGLAEIADYMQDEELTAALTFVWLLLLFGMKISPIQVSTQKLRPQPSRGL